MKIHGNNREIMVRDKIFGYFCQQPFSGTSRNVEDCQKGILLSQYLQKSISCISQSTKIQNIGSKRILASIDG